ncbi:MULTISPECIES: efflux RND transporter permease subunit [unclassified Sphingomonas]|uniref:efflux RND transporter permease subunit n=1 Tax=Sphingomonas TaxID=13687 RepID=UPI000960F0FA|nr:MULTISPECIES: efflux RND transporter permease subunit [unclassified Sphingomonas]MBN8810853.1 efflux RND transporter permease subunit [Sphingomonas sp.]OJY49263.1 MAG: nodulation protein [Sphingomonas sp. 67-41]
MNLSAPFIRRPVGTLLLTLGLMLAGVAATLSIPVSPLPQIDLPTISVTATLSGASPSNMASSVAAPLEKRLGTIAGVTQMTSASSTGSTRITLQFDLGRDIDGAARDVQAAINAARADLPSTLRTNPTYRKVNPADAPIMILALTSDRRSPAEIFDTVSAIVQQRLLQVEGVGDVELGGAALPSVRVDVNPLAVARYGIPLEDVRAALSASAANRPRGLIEGAGLAWQIYADTPGVRAEDFRDLPVASRNGTLVRLEDIANVHDGPEDVRTMGLFNGQRAVMVVITRQPGANIVATVNAVKAALPRLQASIPADVKLHLASDRTTTIRASLREVEITLLIATLLVVGVVSLFLRSLRATLVPAMAVLTSLLGTVAVIYMLGFSLNNLSLMALTVATGFVVDDAIVVVENIARHIERGMKPVQAALTGAREVGFTVLSISASLIAVFIPLLFMGGVVGRLFREFAVTMSVAVAISLVISLTATPMLAALLLRGEERTPRFAQWFERGFEHVRTRYSHGLDRALAHRGITLALLAATVALNVALIVQAPKGLFPEQDTGSLMGGVHVDQSMSFSAVQSRLVQIVGMVKRDPAVADVVAFTGGSRTGGAFLFIMLKQGKRDPARTVINRLRPQLGRITGVTAFLNPVQDLQTGGRSANSSYQYTLQANDPVTLRAAGTKLVDLMKREPQTFTDVDIDQQDGGSETYLTVDRVAAARLGITNQAIDNALYDAFGQRQAVTLYSGLNQYHVVLGVAPEFSTSPEALNGTYVPAGGSSAAATGSAPVSTTGAGRDASTGNAVNTTPATIVPISTIARWQNNSTPAVVNHQGGEPSATVSFNLPNGVTLGQAAERLIAIQRGAGLPATVHGGFAGNAQLLQQSMGSMPLLILAALVAIYLVLGILYESAIHPITILSTIPSAGVGAVVALMLAGMQLDVIGLIAIILLIGIVKKNAILIIDFALDAERGRGLAPVDAIREAALQRFRPIVMTTLAAALGALPLAIGFGEGAELRQPLGVAIVGGLVAAQFLTLFTTPVVFLALDRFRRRSPHERLLARHGPDEPGLEPA